MTEFAMLTFVSTETGSAPAFDAAALAAVVDGNAELRPSLLRGYASETERCYAGRLVHYQIWCGREGLQAGTEWITEEKVLAYVKAQIRRWTVESPEDAPEGYGLLRPSTLRQALSALVYWGELKGDAPGNRQAHEMVRRFYAARQEAPLWRVPGRKASSRRRRR